MRAISVGRKTKIGALLALGAVLTIGLVLGGVSVARAQQVVNPSGLTDPLGGNWSPVAGPVPTVGIDANGRWRVQTFDGTGNLKATDANNASFGAAGVAPVSVTVGTPYSPARSLQLNCTTGGTITFIEAGASVMWIVSVGTTEIVHVTTDVTSLGSAVCPQIYAHY